MNNSLPKEMEFKKLEQIANDWVEEYGGYIAEISFFCSKETSGLNAKEYQYCIDFVLCDPPRIEPVSRFSSGFIAKEAGVMSVRLLGLMPEITGRELTDERSNASITPRQKKEIEFLRQWQIDIRWETDQPNPSYLPESKQLLYSRPQNQPTKKIKFSPEDYKRLKSLPSFYLDECIGLMLGMPYEQTIVAIQKGELDIQTADQVHKKISEYTELLSRSIHDGELKPKKNSLDLSVDDPTFKPQVFLEWAKKKGFEIPISNKGSADDDKKNKNQHYGPPVSKKDSDPLTRSLSPDDFVKTITIRYENDSQITIQVKGKPKIPVPLEQLGYREAGIEWNNFLKVLKSPPDHYWRCPQDKDRQELKKINERLIKWFKRELKISFPKNHKIYERVKNKGKGIYRFIFKVDYPDTIPICQATKDSFRKKFYNLLERYKNEKNESLLENIQEMANEGFSKKFLTEEEVKEALQPERSKINPESEFHSTPGYSIKK